MPQAPSAGAKFLLARYTRLSLVMPSANAHDSCTAGCPSGAAVQHVGGLRRMHDGRARRTPKLGN